MNNWNSIAFVCKEKNNKFWRCIYKFWRCIYKFVFRKRPVEKVSVGGSFVSFDSNGRIIATSKDSCDWALFDGYQRRKMQDACDVMNPFFAPYKFKVGKCSDGYFMCAADPYGLVDEYLFRYSQPVFDDMGNKVGETDWSNDRWVENIEIL